LKKSLFRRVGILPRKPLKIKGIFGSKIALEGHFPEESL
jgi:hypothetical protein